MQWWCLYWVKDNYDTIECGKTDLLFWTHYFLYMCCINGFSLKKIFSIYRSSLFVYYSNHGQKTYIIMYELEWWTVYAITCVIFWCLYINTKITLEWAHKHFAMTVHTLIIPPASTKLEGGYTGIIIPPASTKLKGGYTGITLSVCPSVRLWTESCPLCIVNNTHRIHFIFAHLMKQLQKVCRV